MPSHSYNNLTYIEKSPLVFHTCKCHRCNPLHLRRSMTYPLYSKDNKNIIIYFNSLINKIQCYY